MLARACNGLARYSVSNLCLIVLAKPEASFVAGFRAWLQLGYCVRKGEHAIRIFAKRAISHRVRRAVGALSGGFGRDRPAARSVIGG